MKDINVKEIIEENLDTVDTVIELVPEKKVGFNFMKATGVAIGVGAVVALGVGVYKWVQKKKKDKAQEADNSNVVEASDFEDEE